MYNALPLAAAIENPLWPFVILAIGIIVVIALIGYVRLHAFVALILSAFLVGFLSKGLPVAEDSNRFTVQENLKIWTASLSILGLVGIVQVLILSAIFPFPFGTPSQ